jgi:hypothetical protein
MGLKRTLDLKVVDSFDFFPNGSEFQVMRERKEFQLGPTEDHLQSVFHVIQETGNEHLARSIRQHLDRGALSPVARVHVERLLGEMAQGRSIEGKLSSNHTGFDYANFTRDDVLRALRISNTNDRKKVDHHGGKFASATSGQETARANAH